MRLQETGFDSLFVIEPSVFKDERGYFFESFREEWLSPTKTRFVQDNESKSKVKVMRGFHYQIPPKAQAKLIRTLKGRVIDYALDLRRNSPSFKKVFSIELSEENKKQLFIPVGFAHAFLSLSDVAVVQYKVSEYYSPEHERGIHVFDKDLAIEFAFDPADLILSERDQNLPSLKEAQVFEMKGSS